MTPHLRGFLPAMPASKRTEALRAAAGAGIALLLAGWLLGHLPLGPAQALIAPFGASVFLIFAVPNSPLAQPWSVVIGSTVSALVALAVVHLVSHTALAAGLAVALAILAMAATRSMHPPAGAVALLIALTADPANPPGLLFALTPVADGAALLVLLGILWNRATGRIYPFRQPAPTGPHGTTDPAADRRLGLRPEDLQTILTRLRLSPNLGPEDLGRALEAAEAEATARHLGALTAADIMSRDVVAMLPESTAHDIAQTFRRHGFNTLPVRDTTGHYQGLLHDRDLIGADPTETAATLSRPAQTLPPTATLSDLLPLLSDGHQPSVPITDGTHLTGIVTRSDLITLLAAKIRSQDMP
jgi:CBS domain-containing membrane protein